MTDLEEGEATRLERRLGGSAVVRREREGVMKWIVVLLQLLAIILAFVLATALATAGLHSMLFRMEVWTGWPGWWDVEGVLKPVVILATTSWGMLVWYRWDTRKKG